VTHNASLTIRGLRVRPVDVPLSRPHPTAGGIVSSAPLVLIDLMTNEGVVGSSYVFCYTALAVLPLARLTQNLEQLIKGATVAPVALDQSLQRRFRLLGPQGLTGIAMAGIEMAAWDALARAVDLPLVRLLGGDAQPMQAYYSLSMGGPDTAAREAAVVAELGFDAIKLKVGYATIAEDIAAVRAARGAVGERLRVMVDYNQSLSVPEAIRRCRALEDAGLTWIEEPTLADDFDGHAEIRSEVQTPLQFGENWWGPHDMAKAIDVGASDYVTLDVMKIGGVSGWLRAAALAEAKGLQVSSHLFPQISAHLLAVTPTAHWLEYQDWADPILREPLQPKDGKLAPSRQPGCGMEWDEAAVARYLVA
jgi:mandelate racemase